MLRARRAITIAMPIDDPILRVRLSTAAPSVRDVGGEGAEGEDLQRHEHQADAKALQETGGHERPQLWSSDQPIIM